METRINPNVNDPSDHDTKNTGASLKGLNSAGKPKKNMVDFNKSPLIQQNQPQPDLVLMCGPEGPSGPVTLDTASKLYSTVEKLELNG